MWNRKAGKRFKKSQPITHTAYNDTELLPKRSNELKEGAASLENKKYDDVEITVASKPQASLPSEAAPHAQEISGNHGLVEEDQDTDVLMTCRAFGRDLRVGSFARLSLFYDHLTPLQRFSTHMVLAILVSTFPHIRSIFCATALVGLDVDLFVGIAGTLPLILGVLMMGLVVLLHQAFFLIFNYLFPIVTAIAIGVIVPFSFIALRIRMFMAKLEQRNAPRPARCKRNRQRPMASS